MSIRLGIVMDPIERISYKKDSSMAMLWAAKARGWTLHYFEMQDLYQVDGEARGRGRQLDVFQDPERWFAFGEDVDLPLRELDVILMRKDPPFDNEFVYATYLLEQAERGGTLVVNRPASLRDCNEKFFATLFPELAPPTLVSRRADIIREFARTHGDVILKPLDGMGGMGIFRVKADGLNLGSIIETLNKQGAETVMVQRFVPEIAQGDKRILLIGGVPVPYCLARIPQGSEVRGNLAAGGKGVAQPLSDADRRIAEALAPILAQRGLLLVGLDVIGDKMTEINVTSPTCFQEIMEQTGFDVAATFIDALERGVAERAKA